MFKSTNLGTHEYRVHVINGKVVPYGTMHRGSALNAVAGWLNPFGSPQIRQVEKFVQDSMGRAAPKVRNGSYGMDVAINKNTGKPILIETNPTEVGASSGFLQTPIVNDAVQASIRGKLPVHVLARRGLAGGALGTAGMAAQVDET